MESIYSPLLNIEALEADSAPTFVIKLGSRPIPFDFIFCNDAFRNNKVSFRQYILADESDAILFRSWAQALGPNKPFHKFFNYRWSAVRAGKDGLWKVVRAFGEIENQGGLGDAITPENQEEVDQCSRSSSQEQLIEAQRRDRKISLPTMPRPTLAIRMESLQMMMEISDVGVFEFDTHGKLLHANEAWYRMW